MHEVGEAIETILRVLKKSAERGYIGEPVSQLEHALQCAWFAGHTGADSELVLAALLHDIGHLIAPDAPQMDGLGVLEHEKLGGAFLLELGFPQRLAHLVTAHVAAKRYLTFKYPAYLRKLSEASKGTLAWQGGPMTPGEGEAFEALPDFDSILALRKWDEMAKVVGLACHGLDYYEPMLRTCLIGQGDHRC